MEPLPVKIKVPYIGSDTDLSSLKLPELTDPKESRKTQEQKRKQQASYIEKIRRVFGPDEKLIYPFRTGNDLIQKRPHISDSQYKKNKKKLSKPNFSNSIGCWELDIMLNGEHEQMYLVAINVNTRYLMVEPIGGKSERSVWPALAKMDRQQQELNYPMTTIKSDGEASFPNAIHTVFNRRYQIQTIRNGEIVGYSDDDESKPILYHIVDTSPHTYHNKTVDSVIRTLRNALGENNQALIVIIEVMEQLVEHYNKNKIHRYTRITPAEFHGNIDAEHIYISMMKNELRKVNQVELGTHSYEPGNIVMVHLTTGTKEDKQSTKFTKRRRQYETLAKFIRYDGNTAIIKSFTDPTQREIRVPIFNVQFICHDLNDIYQNGALTPIGEQIKHTFNLSITPK